MGHKQISSISNGRVHKSDEIAEEEKVFERKERFSFKKININKKKKHLYE